MTLRADTMAIFFNAINDLIKVVANAYGHDDVKKFNFNDLSTLNHDIHKLTGIHYARLY